MSLEPCFPADPRHCGSFFGRLSDVKSTGQVGWLVSVRSASAVFSIATIRGPVRPRVRRLRSPVIPRLRSGPSAVAANAPRRLPAGGSGGAPTAGCRFNAMIRPRDPKDVSDEPDAASDGGGGTTCGAISLAEFNFPPGLVRCDAMGS